MQGTYTRTYFTVTLIGIKNDIFPSTLVVDWVNKNRLKNSANHPVSNSSSKQWDGGSSYGLASRMRSLGKFTN